MQTPAKILETPMATDMTSILLVDDDVRNLDVLESILDSPQLRLVRTQTPEEALLALVHSEFACIILDINMPGMNGVDLARLIKTRRRSQQIPIIFLTAYFLEEKDILQGYGVGAVDYLTKPINPAILKSKVDVFVDLFQATQALAKANRSLELEIIQRHKAEEELRQSNIKELKSAHEQLLAASRAKDDFLAILSHELRTPLNPILLVASDAASRLDLPAEARSDFEMIRKNVELEARLIDDLLDLTSITRGKVALDRHTLDVHAVLQESITTIQDEIKQKQITLTLQLNARNTTVFADAVRLQQIFWNLLRNAVKFTHAGGRVTVATRDSAGDSKFTLRITDTGIGMNAEEINRIFNPFSQGDHASDNGHRFGGLGLGLAISHKLIGLLGGQISASSGGRDLGSVFIVELPLAPVGEKPVGLKTASPAIPPPSAPPPKNGRRVLLVEDHEPTRLALSHLLTRRLYEVIAAASLAEARILAGTQSFDLLISDIGLPDGNGCDLMIELNKDGLIRGIALTGYGMEEDLKRSQNAGFIAHLTKPVRIESLEAALYKATQSNGATRPNG
jgi:signal transduction histidine kinase